jgi:hypothetical protein
LRIKLIIWLFKLLTKGEKKMKNTVLLCSLFALTMLPLSVAALLECPDEQQITVRQLGGINRYNFFGKRSIGKASLEWVLKSGSVILDHPTIINVSKTAKGIGYECEVTVKERGIEGQKSILLELDNIEGIEPVITPTLAQKILIKLRRSGYLSTIQNGEFTWQLYKTDGREAKVGTIVKVDYIGTGSSTWKYVGGNITIKAYYEFKDARNNYVTALFVGEVNPTKIK